MHVLLSVILMFFVIRKGRWRNIETYHLTIFYVMICNLLYNVLCKDKMLWQYNPDLLRNSHVMVELLYTFVNLPALTFLFLNSYPFNNEVSKRVGYIAVWVLASLIVEFPIYKMGRLTLKNGYEYWMEPFFYIIMFSFIQLHHKRRLLTYGLSVIVTIVLMFIFKIPLK